MPDSKRGVNWKKAGIPVDDLGTPTLRWLVEAERGASAAARARNAAIFEYMPAIPLSHTCIVTDKLQQIPLWVGEVQRANM